jgi:hypothetical protein
MPRTSMDTLNIPGGPLLRLPQTTQAGDKRPRKSAEEIGLAVLEGFAAHNAQSVADAQALRDEIRHLVATHVGPGICTGPSVLARITRAPRPSLRTVLRYMQAIRNEHR